MKTPHGSGFSFVDRCDIVEPGRRAVGQMWLDPSSWFFEHHFPGKPMMPGVLLLECAAQVAGILWQAGGEMRPLFLAQIQQFRWIKTVLPTQTVEVDVILEKDFGSLAQFEVTILVEKEIVAKGSITMGSSQI